MAKTLCKCRTMLAFVKNSVRKREEIASVQQIMLGRQKGGEGNTNSCQFKI